MFLFYIREEDGCPRRGTRRGMRRGRRGLRRGTRKMIDKRNKKKKYEEDCQTKGMSLFALLKTRHSHFTDYSFTVYSWMTDGRCRRRQLCMIENLSRNLRMKKMSMKQCVHPQLNLYKSQLDSLIDLIFTTFC